MPDVTRRIGPLGGSREALLQRAYSGQRQTSTATPAEPAGLPTGLVLSESLSDRAGRPVEAAERPDAAAGSSPSAPRAPTPLSHATPQRRPVPRVRGLRFRRLPRRLIAHVRPNRVRFLRTGHSPSIAPHLALRRRSYRWVRAGERLPGEDLHLSVMAPLQAHATPAVGGTDLRNLCLGPSEQKRSV